MAQHEIKDLFKYRGWAVHAKTKYREPLLRADVDRGVDWHYAAFRAENTVNALHMTAQMLDVLVELFDRGSEELREWAPFARARLDEVLDLFDAIPGLLPLKRAHDEKAADPAADGPPGHLGASLLKTRGEPGQSTRRHAVQSA